MVHAYMMSLDMMIEDFQDLLLLMFCIHHLIGAEDYSKDIYEDHIIV